MLPLLAITMRTSNKSVSNPVEPRAWNLFATVGGLALACAPASPMPVGGTEDGTTTEDTETGDTETGSTSTTTDDGADPSCSPHAEDPVECGPDEWCTKDPYAGPWYCYTSPDPTDCHLPFEMVAKIPMPDGTDENAVDLAFVETTNSGAEDLLILTPDGLQLLVSPITQVSDLPLPPGEPVAMVVGSVDDDEWDDIVVLDRAQTGSIRSLVADGAGGFNAGAGLADVGSLRGPVLGDYDLDGAPDVLAISSESLRMFAGDGAGGFAPGVEIANELTSNSLGVMDIDPNDGYVDTDIAYFTTRTVVRRGGSGDLTQNEGPFTYDDPPMLVVRPGGITVAGVYGGDSFVLEWVLYTDPLFLSLSQHFRVPGEPISLDVGKFNDDTSTDVVIGFEDGFGVHFGATGDLPAWNCWLRWDTKPARILATGEVDNDKETDVALSDGESVTIYGRG
jgi:hypothetical protein